MLYAYANTKLNKGKTYLLILILFCVIAAVFVNISTYQLPGFKLLLSRMQFCFVLFNAVMFDAYAKDCVQIRPLTTDLAALGYLKNQIIKLWSHRFLIFNWIALNLEDNEVNKILNKNFCQIQLRTCSSANEASKVSSF